MKLYFYRGKHPNFGDELNNWLLPRVLPKFFDDDDSSLFLGIGSVIYDHCPRESIKIVFGSGYDGHSALPRFDDTWKFYCVRGPRTADACNLGREKIAGDAAILINRFRLTQRKKSIRYSFMPHWQSVERGNWELACSLADIHFIDPRKPVERILEDIEASSVVIAEAMHGAIVADALRIPWIPVLPIDALNRLKWYDWAEALDINLARHRIWPSSAVEAWFAQTKRGGSRLKKLRGLSKMAVQCLDRVLVQTAALRLSRTARLDPMLSSAQALARAIERLDTNAEKIKRDFARG
jgi:hypothetical protein